MRGRWLWGGVAILLLWGLTAVGWGETNVPVRVQFTDGSVIEGVVLEEREREIVVRLSMAGGTILKTETLARTNLVAVTPLSAEELAQRAEAEAFETARRYALNAQRSYPAGYYSEVITGVFRPFLEKYPHSPQAPVVAGWISEWQAEQRLVESGRIKYRGVWLTAAEAGARMEQEEGARLLAQARALAQRGRFEQAIATVRLLPGAEAKQFCASVAPRWVAALEAEQQSLKTQIEQAQQTIRAAEEQRAAVMESSGGGRGLNTGTVTKMGSGPSKEDLVALNKANAAARTAAAELERNQSRLAAVERELSRAHAAAREFGVAAPATTTAGGAASPASGAPQVQDVQSGRVERGASENPELLQQIAEFFHRYWMPVALAALIGIWYFSRRLSR